MWMAVQLSRGWLFNFDDIFALIEPKIKWFVFIILKIFWNHLGRVLENDGLSGRIVNGEDANVGDRPFQVKNNWFIKYYSV